MKENFADYVRSRIEYDPESGILKWKPRIVKNSIDKMWNTRFSGRRITHKNSTGHIQFGLDGKNYLGHRIAWLIVYGEIPSIIDHSNGVRDDNRIVNLREATFSQNNTNTKNRSNNTSGFRGVNHRRNNKSWSAQISVVKKKIHLGTFDCPYKAAKAYDDAAQKYHGEFATLNIGGQHVERV